MDEPDAGCDSQRSAPADLTSDKFGPDTLYDEASTVIVQKLSQIQGVGQVNPGGGALPSVRVDVNPTQLNSYGLTLANVQSMLSLQNSDTPKGQISNGLVTADIVANDQINHEQAAVDSAKKYLDLETNRYNSGIDPYVDVVIAQTTLLTDQQTFAPLHVQQMTSAVELIEALGGGWDKSQLPSPAQVSQKPDKADRAIQQ